MTRVSCFTLSLMATRKATLISNPKTGRYGSRRRSIQDVASDLESLGLKVDLQLTGGPGDATEIAARAARDGYTDVIVAGGDGTINEAIQGLAGTDARLAIIPRGTGNVLARELGLPLDEEQAVAVAAAGKSRKIYLGLVVDETTNESRHFVLMAGIGLDASVVQGVQPSLNVLAKAPFGFPVSVILQTGTRSLLHSKSTATNTTQRLQRSERRRATAVTLQSHPARDWINANSKSASSTRPAGDVTCICFHTRFAVASRATNPKCDL